jgi:diguanylate cyclase (GGDEF)-like protein/putative nucleotidyltransferase with HDIG domain
MARWQAVIMASAGVLGYAGVLLPHDADANLVGLTLIQLTAVLGGAALFVFADRAPVWLLRINPPLSAAMTTAAVYFSGDLTSAYTLFYFWPCIYAFYFFSWREALFNVLFVCANYVTLIIVMESPAGVLADRGVAYHVVMTVGTLLVAGASLIALRGRVDSLFDRLSEAARTDPLTRLPNRVALHEILERDLARAASPERPLSLLIIDLDEFKQLNEAHGIEAGDRTIKRIANLLQESTRLIDVIARAGGDEFAAILHETDQHSAFLKAEELLASVRQPFNAHEPETTASIGVATFPGHGADAAGLIASADKALYAAKALGRDRAVLFSPEVTTTLGAIAGQRNIESQAQLATVLSLAEALDQRDSSTARHSQTVGTLCEAMARELGFDETRVQRVRLAGILHDIGKIGVPDSILRKPGALTPEERAQMRRHPELGARILSSREMDDIRSWISTHHERPDGLGYPKGLVADEIPIEASILAVADAYEAMIADRVYRMALGPEEARKELRRCSGNQFEPRVVDALIRALDRDAVAIPVGGADLSA